MASLTFKNTLIAVSCTFAILIFLFTTPRFLTSTTQEASSKISKTGAKTNLFSHAPHGYCGVPPTPDPRTFEQPNGSTFQAYIRLQSDMVYLETIDGFTIMKDPLDGYYRYA
ncbi:MAG: hypothetical protein AAGJ93_10450, partial [Bacteroidota bacterium]